MGNGWLHCRLQPAHQTSEKRGCPKGKIHPDCKGQTGPIASKLKENTVSQQIGALLIRVGFGRYIVFSLLATGLAWTNLTITEPVGGGIAAFTLFFSLVMAVIGAHFSLEPTFKRLPSYSALKAFWLMGLAVIMIISVVTD